MLADELEPTWSPPVLVDPPVEAVLLPVEGEDEDAVECVLDADDAGDEVAEWVLVACVEVDDGDVVPVWVAAQLGAGRLVLITQS